MYIDIKNLNAYYGAVHALQDINIGIEKNKVTALIGPSGCGKSTFLRTINRVHELIEGTRVEGTLLLNGHDIYAKEVDAVSIRRRIGMVFQKANPFPTMSIYQNVASGLILNGFVKKKHLDEVVERSLEQANLLNEVKDRLHKNASELSGGQQQRLCIARTIAVQPEIILMDEPTSALDPFSTMKIEELIIKLKKNFTIIIVTHNMQQAARMSDSVAFFLNGSLVEYGSTEQIFTSPVNKKTEDYITGRFG